MSNGVAHHQTNGRAVQEHQYSPYTFATGVTVYYRKVSGSALRELPKALRKEPEFRKPEPPIDQTDLGPMPNEDHPAYLAALKEWQERFNMELSLRSAKLLIAMAVRADAIDVDDAKRTLAQMAKYGGIDISGYDLSDPDDLKVAYVLYVAMADEDSEGIINAILRKSMVTAEAVQEKVDTFQSDVGRSISVPLPNIPVGAELQQ